jgi:hypothetical protein
MNILSFLVFDRPKRCSLSQSFSTNQFKKSASPCWSTPPPWNAMLLQALPRDPGSCGNGVRADIT